MARTPEGKVKTAVKKILEEHGVFYFFPPANGLGRSGIPDIVCCIDGKFVGIEVKTEKGVLSALQDVCHADIRASGGNVFVVWGMSDIPALKARLRILYNVGR